MSNWHMYELEDMWVELHENDDHIVPHPGDERVDGCEPDGDCHKNPEREVVITREKEEIRYQTLKDKNAPILKKGSWSQTPDGVCDASCDTGSLKEMTNLLSDDNSIYGHCFKSRKIDSVGNMLCADDSTLSNKCTAVDNLCQFPLGQISQADSDLEFFSNNQDDREISDFLDYEWPDIGNFEDVDKMFGSCDSTFGQGNASKDYELSWFAANSHAIDVSEDVLKSSFESSYSESTELKSTLEQDEADMKYMPNFVPLINNFDKNDVPNMHKTNRQTFDADDLVILGHSSFVNWSDGNAVSKKEFTSKGQEHEINGGGLEVQISPVSQTNNESLWMINLSKQSLKPSKSEGKRKDRHPDYLSSGALNGHGRVNKFQNVKFSPTMASAPQVFPSPDIQQQKQSLGPISSSYLHTYASYVNSELNRDSSRIPGTPSSNIKSERKRHPSSSSKASSHASNYAQPVERFPNPSQKAPATTADEKIKNLCQWEDVQGILTTDTQHKDLVVQAAFTDQVSVQKEVHQIQSEVGCHSDTEGVSTEIPVAEVDSSIAQNSSCMSSELDEFSMKANSFRQLHHVMEQLDFRTKLCIRDSLYRLARSAEQRHSFGHSNCSSRNSRDITGVLTADEPKRCPDFMDMETDTNPIDRSIAHLLFHRPIDPSLRPSSDSLSLESHNMIPGSITGQPVMFEKLVCQEDTTGRGIADTM